MAIYRTNTEELTSIANAIRAKTGDNSSLIYPTGFVSAIQNISYNWMGTNVELVNTIYEQTIKLSDTSFNAASVTTNNSTIYSGSNYILNDLATTYDYIQMIYCYVTYAYTGSPEQKGMSLETYFAAAIPFGAKSSTPSDFINEIFNYTAYGTGINTYNTIMYNANGNQTLTGNPYGINFSLTNPSFSNRNASTFNCTLYSPAIRINSNSGQMSSASINALDTENTKIYMKVNLYRSDQVNYVHALNQETMNLYKQVHNIT